MITPILRNVKPNPKINTILKWEGILIDPLGALIAVLAYEFVRSSRSQEAYTLVALKGFFLTIATGVFIGIICAFLLYYLLRKNRLPSYLRNVVTLAIVIMGFAFSEFLMRESGLMTATIMGIILANLRIPEMKHILSFKEDINIILISVLFIILSSTHDNHDDDDDCYYFSRERGFDGQIVVAISDIHVLGVRVDKRVKSEEYKVPVDEF